jgi:putative resolvase
MNEQQSTERLYTIREAADAVGVSTSTLKRWELQHQITPQRVANGQRIYTERDLQRLRSLKERRL